MSSAENVKLVREAYEAALRDDWAALSELAVPDFEWEPDARVVSPGIYRGEEHVRRYFEEEAATLESSRLTVEQVFTNGDQVVAFVRVQRRPHGSTAEVEILIGHLWTVRDGKLVRCRGFAKREEALAAADIAVPAE